MLLCRGARVLLNQNLYPEAGLMNGALGKVKGFIENGIKSRHRSFFVLVGDRGMLTQTQLDAVREHPGLGWISALQSFARVCASAAARAAWMSSICCAEMILLIFQILSFFFFARLPTEEKTQ